MLSMFSASIWGPRTSDKRQRIMRIMHEQARKSSRTDFLQAGSHSLCRSHVSAKHKAAYRLWSLRFYLALDLYSIIL